MLSDVYLYGLGLVVSLALYWAAPSNNPNLRARILLVVSAAMVALYSPGGLLVCGYLVIVPLLAVRVFARFRSTLSFWAALCAVLAPIVFVRLATDQDAVFSFGLAFATVKSVGLVILAYGGRFPIQARDAALLIFFFPLFTIGPVERLRSFAAEKFATTLSIEDVVTGLRRAVIGLFVIYFVCGDLLGPIRDVWLGRSAEALADFSQAEAFALVYVSFLFTYMNFVGFTEIALGASRLFGLKIVENFDRPLLAPNPAEFWKRYHISMGDWINQFLYFPIAVLIRHPAGSYIAIVIAFVLFGLWHAFTWNYFIWGLGNGSAVALCHLFTRSQLGLPKNRAAGGALRLVIWALSITFVALMQTIGNLAGMAETGILLSALIG